jgi:hypothetical protein
MKEARKVRKLMLLIAAVLSTTTAVAFAQSSPTGKERANAARMCSAQRTQLGAAGFAQQWGSPSNAREAFGKCVSKTARTLHQNAVNAARQCRAEQDDATFAASHDGKTFAQFYGTNADLSNAFGNCVSLKKSVSNAETQQELVNPARYCRAQRDSMGEKAFADLYGTNDNKRNAFGKCVSNAAQSMRQNFQDASQQCRAEQNDPTFAASHGGKTFTQAYGTNANGSNAFGKCVSQKAKSLNQADQQATVKAARQCQAERKQIGEPAFRKKYRTFGNCVAQKAKQS